jgi:23S rRNA (cytidine1920-2'-O)/16S rRNA (cytidine1409-2'-O)-methyltransferase
MGDLFTLVADGAAMVLLVKPQFEAGKPEVDRGSGVIRDPEVWERVLVEVERSIRGHGAAIMEGMVSPITGAYGNVEFLVHVVRGEAPVFEPALLVAEATGLTGGGGS